MSDERVLAEDHGPIRLLTLNRPEKLNAADVALQRRLNERWREVHDDPAVRAVVLTGAGRAFCAGGDLSLLLGEGAEEARAEAGLNAVHRDLLRLMLSLEVPVIAAVNGPALGFGAEVVALCDLVVISADAYLADPHVIYGVAASPGLQVVWPHLTSHAAGKEILLTGRRVEADEALRLGLVNRVVPAAETVPAALALAEALAALPREGIATTKRAFNRILLEEEARGEWA